MASIKMKPILIVRRTYINELYSKLTKFLLENNILYGIKRLFKRIRLNEDSVHIKI